MSIVDKIRVLAKKEGMSLPDLEIKLGLGNGTISRWKNSSPNTDKLTKVADHFNVSMDYLLGREESNSLKLEDVYLRLAKGAQELGLDENDVSAILNLYKAHNDKNNL